MTNKVSELSFIKHVIISSIIVFVIAVYPVYIYADKLRIYSILCGYIIGLINAILGYKLNKLAFSRSVKSFMVIVFGGMGIRILIIALLLMVLLYAAKLDEVSLVASVFFFYILFAVLEINYLHRSQIQTKKELSPS